MIFALFHNTLNFLLPNKFYILCCFIEALPACFEFISGIQLYLHMYLIFHANLNS